MDAETLRNYCLSLNGVTESFPFDEHVLAFKVKGKIFALTDIDKFESVNLKCEPGEAIELREKYEAVLPGYHMDKKHWNTVMMKSNLPDALIKEWIKNSYELVVAKLSKKLQNELRNEERMG